MVFKMMVWRSFCNGMTPQISRKNFLMRDLRFVKMPEMKVTFTIEQNVQNEQKKELVSE